MAHPEKIPQVIKKELRSIGLWDLHSRNLFRLTWKNEPVKFGGGFGDVNYLEIPKELSGVKARIIVLVGKYFPTGSHKVGATFGPLVEKLIRGAFDPTTQKALWPSTGNYCRGGAYDSYLLACPSIAVLPEGMSRERFTWLEKIGAEIHATPGSESNVKEVYDKSFELSEDKQKLTALFLTQGSAGTLGCADYLREKFPSLKVCAGEAWQCPTLLLNGYGAHRIEGIGDKHVPWIHNLKNMDMVAEIDDEYSMRLLRLFNEPTGKKYLGIKGIPEETIDKLHLLGISSIANLIGAIKMAKYYEMNENDIVFTIATDSMELYQSRIKELRKERGNYTDYHAAADFDTCLMNR